MRTHAALLIAPLWASLASAQGTYTPPPASVQAVIGIDFASGVPLTELQSRYSACDRTDMCDGKKLDEPYKCSGDKSGNTAILKLKGDVVFFDAKMALDADGSALSMKMGGTNASQTSLHYPTPPRGSVDAEHVPYVVLPNEFVAEEKAALRRGVKIRTGDIAAVVYQGNVVYALVADIGPACKIGEGSMKLHDELGHPSCVFRDAKGTCMETIRDSIEDDVLYFIFPGSASLISKGLSPCNVNQRLNEQGPTLMRALRRK